MLQRFFADESRKQFYEALDAVSPNVAGEAIELFNQWWRLGPVTATINSLAFCGFTSMRQMKPPIETKRVAKLWPLHLKVQSGMPQP
jgi:hypothetical protein